MLELKSQISISDCNCEFERIDVTGEHSDINLSGFIPDGVALPSNKDFYKDSGNFFDILYHNQEYILSDIKIKPSNDAHKMIAALDGVLHNIRIFIINDTFYNSVEDDWFDPNLPVMFYDQPSKRIVYRASAQDMYLNDLQEVLLFLNGLESTDDIQGISISVSRHINICNIVRCYTDKLRASIGSQLGYNDKTNKFKCPGGGCMDYSDSNADLSFLRGAVYLLKDAIKCNNLEDADTLLTLLSKCNSICPSTNRHINGGGNNGCSGCK